MTKEQQVAVFVRVQLRFTGQEKIWGNAEETPTNTMQRENNLRHILCSPLLVEKKKN